MTHFHHNQDNLESSWLRVLLHHWDKALKNMLSLGRTGIEPSLLQSVPPYFRILHFSTFYSYSWELWVGKRLLYGSKATQRTILQAAFDWFSLHPRNSSFWLLVMILAIQKDLASCIMGETQVSKMTQMGQNPRSPKSHTPKWFSIWELQDLLY
jgi:hypothetical protein